MDYELSRHANDVIRERRITIEWAESVLKNPILVEADKNDPLLEHRLARIHDYGGRILRGYNRQADEARDDNNGVF